MNTLLEKKAVGKPSYGTFSQLTATASIEGLAHTGLDYVIIDSEHAQLGTDFVYNAIVAADSAGICPLVRIGEISRRSVLHPLDAGAKGLVVPAVETVEEVQKLISYAKFAPIGNRGYALTRDCKWGTDAVYAQGAAHYMDACNSQILLFPQCETRGCLDHIEEIVALDGVDGIFVGPMDLSIALGRPLEMNSPIMRDAIERILTACHQSGKLALIFSNDAADARKMIQRGFDSVTVSADVFLLVSAYQSLAKELLNL